MKILKKEEINESIIEEISSEIKKGKIVIFPTETIYGIGTTALDDKACEKIYTIKGRPANRPMIVLISNIEMLKELTEEVGIIEQKLIDAFWPGPLTIIFKKKQGISDIVTGGLDTVGVRMTSGEVIQKIIQKSGVPIVAPSANLTGKDAGTKIDIIKKELGKNVDYILDYGDIDNEVPSTLVKVENDNITILREGKITKEEINKIL